jgi:hypothetical protein
MSQSNRSSRVSSSTVVPGVASIVLAAAFGIGCAGLLASIESTGKFNWAWLALAPAWFVLEVVFELFAGFFGERTPIVRYGVVVALLAGFYGTWFWLRPL